MVSIGTIVGTLILDDQLSPALKLAEQNLASAGKSMRKLGGDLQSAGAAMLPMSAAVAAFGAFAIKAASDFESSFAGVRKTVEATEDQFAQLSAGLRAMAQEIPVGVDELNSIAAAAGQLGIETENILQFTRVMADLAVTTNLTSEEAASSLARLANITNMPQENFERLGSTIVALGNNMATTEAEIVEFGLRIAGAGEIAGLTEAQILSIGAAMSSVGVEAEAGGTSVQKVLLGMTEAVAQGNNDLETFADTAGMSAEKFADAFKNDAAGAFASFVEGLGRAGTEAFQILGKLGMEDQRLIRSFLSLAGAGDLLRESITLGSTAWEENIALAREAEQRYKTFESQVKILWNQIRDVAIEIGTALLPSLRGVVTVLQTSVVPLVRAAAEFFAALPDPIRAATLALGALVAVAAPAVISIGTAISLAGGFAQAMGLGIGGILKVLPAWISQTDLAVVAQGKLAATTALASKAIDTQSKTLKFAAGEQLALDFGKQMQRDATGKFQPRLWNAEQQLLPLSGAMTQTAGAAASVTVATEKAAASTSLLTRAMTMLTGPVGIVIGGLATLAAVIYAVETAETDLERQARESTLAFQDQTDKLARAHDTFIAASRAQTEASERGIAGFAEHATKARELDKATRELAIASGLSEEAFEAETQRSDDLVESIAKQIRARKELLVMHKEDAREAAAEAAEALAAAQQELANFSGERIVLGPGEIPTTVPMQSRERAAAHDALINKVKQLQEASRDATDRYNGLLGVIASTNGVVNDVDLSLTGAEKAEVQGKKIADAFEAAEAALKKAQAELGALSAVDTSRLTKLLQAGNVEIETLHKRTGVSVEALRLLQKHIQDAGRIAKEARNDLDSMFGKDALAKATLYADAVGSVANVSKLSEQSQQELYNTLMSGIAVLEAAGKGTTAQADKMRSLAAATIPAKNAINEFAEEWARAEAAMSTGVETAEQAKRRISEVARAQDQASLIGKRGLARQLQDLKNAHAARERELEEQYGRENQLARELWETNDAIFQQGLQDVLMTQQRSAIELSDQLILETSHGRARLEHELGMWYARELEKLNQQGHLTHDEHARQLDALNALYREKLSRISDLKRILADSLFGALEGIPDMIAQGLANGGDWSDIAESIASTIGAAFGEAIGFYFAGPGGAAIGRAAGSMLGKVVDAIYKSRAERTAERAAYDFGRRISEELAQGIEDAAEDRFGGNRDAAKVFMLGDVISEIGLSAETYAPMVARLRDTFVQFGTGAFTAAEAVQVLDENFQQFIDFVGGDVTPELKEIIQLTDEFGLASKAVADYTTGQAQRALEGLGSFITTRGEIVEKLADAEKRLAELTRRGAGGSASEVRAVREEIAKLQEQLASMPLTGDFGEAAGAALFGIFERLTRNGEPALEVIKSIDDLIFSLDKQLRAAGESGGAAFNQLKAMARLANDEAIGPALEAIVGLGSALEGLNNSAILTQEQFTGITGQIVALIEAQEAQGKTVEELYPFIAGSLQTIWELHKDFGYAIDDETKKMLEQAEAAGVVGEEHRSAQEKMLIATEQMRDAVLLLADSMGVELPEAMQEAIDRARGLKDAVDDIPNKVNVRVDYQYEQPEFNPRAPTNDGFTRNYALGGLVKGYTTGGLVVSAPSGSVGIAKGYATGGLAQPQTVAYAADGGEWPWAMSGPRGTDNVPAWLTVREYVIPAPAVSQIGPDKLDDLVAGRARVVRDTEADGRDGRSPLDLGRVAGDLDLGVVVGRLDFGSDDVGGLVQAYASGGIVRRHNAPTEDEWPWMASGSRWPHRMPEWLTAREYALPTPSVSQTGYDRSGQFDDHPASGSPRAARGSGNGGNTYIFQDGAFRLTPPPGARPEEFARVMFRQIVEEAARGGDVIDDARQLVSMVQ